MKLFSSEVDGLENIISVILQICRHAFSVRQTPPFDSLLASLSGFQRWGLVIGRLQYKIQILFSFDFCAALLGGAMMCQTKLILMILGPGEEDFLMRCDKCYSNCLLAAVRGRCYLRRLHLSDSDQTQVSKLAKVARFTVQPFSVRSIDFGSSSRRLSFFS